MLKELNTIQIELAYIALIKYEDKNEIYYLPQKLEIGDTVEAGKNVEIKVGNCLELIDIPQGSAIHNIELVPNSGGKMARSAGSSATLTGFDGDHAIIRLGSGKQEKLAVNVWLHLDLFLTQIKKILKLVKLVELDGKVKDHNQEVL